MKDELFAMTFREFCKKKDIRLKSMDWGTISGLDIVCSFKDMRNSEFRIHARKFGVPSGFIRLTIRIRKYDMEGHYSVRLAKGMALAYKDDKAMGLLYDFLKMYAYDDSLFM